jgi:hypothetical protein
MKTFKCDHIISTAVRLELVSWDPILLDLPLARKNKPGAIKQTKPALLRQSIEPEKIAPRLIEQSGEDELVAVVAPKK